VAKIATVLVPPPSMPRYAHSLIPPMIGFASKKRKLSFTLMF